MQRRIVDTCQGQLAHAGLNVCGLVYQKRDAVPVGEFGILGDGYPAIVIVIAESNIDGSNLAQACEESKQMRQTFRHVEQITRDENPVGPEFIERFHYPVMTRLVAVKMEVAQVHCTATGQRSVP